MHKSFLAIILFLLVSACSKPEKSSIQTSDIMVDKAVLKSSVKDSAQIPAEKINAVSSSEENLPGFVISCGGGCALQYEAKEIIDTPGKKTVTFLVTTFIHEDEDENHEQVWIFHTDKSGSLVKITDESGSEVIDSWKSHDKQTVMQFWSKISLTKRELAEIPKGGTYTYDAENAEWQGMLSPKAFSVEINGLHIKIISTGVLSGEKGEIVQEGSIIKYQSGNWIIAENLDDISAPEVGGCTDGPMVMDFKKKRVVIC